MQLADFIRTAEQEPGLRFLIIGGYAVAAHGHTRATFDVDFLARRAEREAWLARLEGAGLALYGETRAFAQFTQPQGGDGLDLMFVEESTFDRIWQASEERDFGGSRARVPCLDHLLALKLHALKQALPHRTSQDAEDVEMLVRRNGVNLHDPRYEPLFLTYGTEKSRRPSFASCEVHDSASVSLALPEADGFRALPPRVSLARLMERNGQFRDWFPAGLRKPEERWQAKTTAEFHL